MTRRYYEEEIRYLHEAGKAFAEAYPEHARLLNIDSVTDRDPYVERLFEGFAFLTGRIRERLDDEMPEYTESLCQLLFPHFLKPVPALSLVVFMPRPGAVQDTTVLERGALVLSDRVGDQRTECRFVTTSKVVLHPLVLRGAELTWQAGGSSSATLAFEVEGNAKLADLRLSPLRLYFHTDPTTASLMHLYFTRHVRKVELRLSDSSTAPTTLLGSQWVQPGGLGADESLLPEAANTFSGFRLLQEYMVFRRKFWCIDLLGLERLPAGDTSRFEVEVFFDRSYPEDRRFRKEDLRLYCTPIINLFEHDAEPIYVDHRVPEYRVIPSVQQQMEIYDVQHGVGIEERTGRRRSYVPFESFQNSRDQDLRYFTTSRRFGPTGRFDTFVNINPLDQNTEQLATETLSLETRCTNGVLPREKLQEGMITQLAPGQANIARPNNLTQPSLILYPPMQRQKDFFWKLISHWSLNYHTLAHRQALQGVLELYDWTTTDANRRRIDGIRDVTWKAKEQVQRGLVQRGVEVSIQVQEDHFADEGDVALFGLVMSHFFSTYATINSFVHLNVEALLSGKTYQWQPKHGTQPLL